MRSRQHGEPDGVSVLLQRGLGHLLGRLEQPGVDDLEARVAQRRAMTLTSVMTVEAGLGHDDSIGPLHGGHPKGCLWPSQTRAAPRSSASSACSSGHLLIVLVLFANNSGGGDSSHTSPARARFDVGPSGATGPTTIERPDTALLQRHGHRIAPDRRAPSRHRPEDGWIAFDAAIGSCTLTWHRESQDFTDCNGKRVPADGDDLHHYPAVVENDDVIVDLSVDATTTYPPS